MKVNAYGVDSILMMIRDLNIRQLRILIEHARHAATIQLYKLPEICFYLTIWVHQKTWTSFTNFIMHI